MILANYLSFYNKFILFLFILLLLLKYPFNFDKNKKHFSLQRNALTLKEPPFVEKWVSI
jgi:hypothetical protein